jgi:hypothetical protein
VIIGDLYIVRAIADRGRIFVWRQRSESVYLYQFHGLHDRDGAPGVGAARNPRSFVGPD